MGAFKKKLENLLHNQGRFAHSFSLETILEALNKEHKEVVWILYTSESNVKVLFYADRKNNSVAYYQCQKVWHACHSTVVDSPKLFDRYHRIQV